MQTKAPHPGWLPEAPPDIHPVIQVYFDIFHLKQLFRQGWLLHGVSPERCESVAEHSFGVAMVAMMLADNYFPALDSLKILRMALIHDVGEIFAGDIVPGAGITPERKHELEKAAVLKVLDPLPNKGTYISAWDEYESGLSSEAVFVRQIDKLEMALQAKVYENQDLANLQDFYQSAAQALTTPKLKQILSELTAL